MPPAMHGDLGKEKRGRFEAKGGDGKQELSSGKIAAGCLHFKRGLPGSLSSHRTMGSKDEGSIFSSVFGRRAWPGL